MTLHMPDKPDLAVLLARSDDLRQAERRAASTRMISVTGHLIGTPLNIIAGRAALIRSNLSADAVEGNVRRIEEQVERLSLRIRRLIDYFGLPEPPAGRRTVAETLAECLGIYGPIATLRGIELRLCADGVEGAFMDATLAPLVLTTLLSLGIRRTAAGQTISVDASEQGASALTFELVLPGIEPPPANFERLEPPEQGAPCDPDALEVLAICLGLARRSGGGLSVQQTPPGTGMTVCFECARC
jgi:two-component system, NtrC family, sensor kinase